MNPYEELSERQLVRQVKLVTWFTIPFFGVCFLAGVLLTIASALTPRGSLVMAAGIIVVSLGNLVLHGVLRRQYCRELRRRRQNTSSQADALQQKNADATD